MTGDPGLEFTLQIEVSSPMQSKLQANPKGFWISSWPPVFASGPD